MLADGFDDTITAVLPPVRRLARIVTRNSKLLLMQDDEPRDETDRDLNLIMTMLILLGLGD